MFALSVVHWENLRPRQHKAIKNVERGLLSDYASWGRRLAALKRLDLNFECLLGSAVVHWENLRPRQNKAIKNVERGLPQIVI